METKNYNSISSSDQALTPNPTGSWLSVVLAIVETTAAVSASAFLMRGLAPFVTEAVEQFHHLAML